MPYIVTMHARTGPSCSPEGCDCEWEDTHHAVATLEEARALCDEAAERAEAHWYSRDDITESGGTIGPLPDGTLIEIERVGWPTLATALNKPWP